MSGIWAGTTDVTRKLEEGASREEREFRSVALEKTYVHDVYQEIACHFTDTSYRAWPRVKQFLLDLEPGSIVCDVGCGNGKHMGINPHLFKLGVDRSSNLANATRDKAYEVLTADNLALPFRDDCVDAVLSVAVVHHFATAGRRVEALRELARVLRIGGKILVSVWAMEQRHRKFESQDVLVPWNRPLICSSDDKTSSIERDLNSTTTTSDDDATHYHAYTQTSDSDSFPSLRDLKKRVRLRHRGQSIDPACSSQSSSDLSSPNESCYTFVRRAIQKLARSKRTRVGRGPWFLQGLGLGEQDELIEPLASMDEDAGEDLKEGDHDLGSSSISELFKFGESSSMARRSLIFSNLLSTRRRRTLETTRELQNPPQKISSHPKSKSLSDLLGMIPIGLFRSTWNRSPDTPIARKQVSVLPPEVDPGSNFLKLDFDLSQDDVEFPEYVAHKAVQTEGFESLSFTSGSLESRASSLAGHYKGQVSLSPDTGVTPKQGSTSRGMTTSTHYRPPLVKQKHSVTSPLASSFDLDLTQGQESKEESKPEVSWGDIKTSVKNLPEFKPLRQDSDPLDSEPTPPAQRSQRSSLRVSHHPGPWKQSSLNEDLIFTERLREKEKLKQNITKQCSLNEQFLHCKENENTRWDQMKEAFLNPSNVKCIQLLKNGISNRLRGYETAGGGQGQGHGSVTPLRPQVPPTPAPQTSTTNSIRSGLVRILQNWKHETTDESAKSSSTNFMGSRHVPTNRRSLFPPFFLRRNSAGSLNAAKKDLGETSPLKLLSPPPYLSRKPSENDILNDSGAAGRLGTPVGNKLAPGVRHVRKLSREDGGSDSSKDSSFQSDTSVDSEDSFASVIFIPKGGENGGNEFFGSETRANSTDSDRSSKSPALRLSPPNHSSTPKSPSPLATETGRRRSPDMSPTRYPVAEAGHMAERGNKFNFDDNVTQLLWSSVAGPLAADSPAQNLNLGQLLGQEQLPDIILAPPPILAVAEDVPVHLDRNDVIQQESTQVSPKPTRIEKIDVLRKPVNLPKNKAEITRKMVRRSIPKGLAVELYNPETDDADTSESSSSSPDSVSSVVSVVTEDSAAAGLRRETGEATATRVVREPVQESIGSFQTENIQETAEPKPAEEVSERNRRDIEEVPKRDQPSITETGIEASHYDSAQAMANGANQAADAKLSSRDSSVEGGGGSFESSDSFGSHSSPQSKRKLTLARLGNTTNWLSSIPSSSSSSDINLPGPSLNSASKRSAERRASVDRRPSADRHPGEKILLGEVKKLQPKGPDAKWPSSFIDESPPQTRIKGQAGEDEREIPAIQTPGVQGQSPSMELAERLLEELEEQDSLFDSIENLTCSRQDSTGFGQNQSRNPSFDSSLRMSSTCSCSIRGGDSFESYYSSAKSSTNSSSHRHSGSFTTQVVPPGSGGAGPTMIGGINAGRRRRRTDTSKSSSVAGGDEEIEDSSGPGRTYHRYYHVFREGELDKLIEKYVQILHIISSYYDHANWCIIAEKVQVWTI